MNVTELIIRIVLTFLFLLLLTRIMGRKEVGQMTFFNFVSSITIGSIAATLVTNNEFAIEYGLLALFSWTLLTLIMDAIDIKTIRGRHLISGNPLIVIKDGKIIEKSLLCSRLSLDELNSLLRQQSIFSVTEVDYAIFETNGKLSVMKKDVFIALTKFDMKLPENKKIYPIPTTLISDGRVLQNNLNRYKIKHDWLIDELKKMGAKSVEEIFFAQLQTDGSLFIEKKQEII